MSTIKHGRWGVERETIRVVKEPKHTQNLFGPMSVVAGQELEVYETNRDHVMVCVCGRYFVNVDHRDIEKGSE